MGDKDISFGSFNLLNLQVPGQAVYRDTDGWDEGIFNKKVAWSCAALQRIAADVVGFQELWAEEALLAVLCKAGMDKTHEALVPPGHPGNGIVNAAAVRRDIYVEDSADWIVCFPNELILRSTGDDPQQPDICILLDRFSRPVLNFRVHVHPDTPEIEVFVCHFKSRRPTQIWSEHSWYDKDVHGPHATAIGYALSTIRRTAEAAALRVIVTKKAKKTKTPIVVIGDMNDGKASNTMNILSEQPNYLSPLSRGGGDNALYAAQTLQEYRSVRDVYFTYVFKGQRESLDHILFSEQFYDNSKRRLWAFHELTVENDHLNFDDHETSGTSDHGILRVGFKWKPEPGALD